MMTAIDWEDVGPRLFTACCDLLDHATFERGAFTGCEICHANIDNTTGMCTEGCPRLAIAVAVSAATKGE